MSYKQIGAALLCGVVAAGCARHEAGVPVAPRPSTVLDAPLVAPPRAPGVHPEQPEHEMWMRELGGGWSVVGMAQVFPVLTIGAPGRGETPLRRTQAVLTQPALMANLEAPDSRFAVRTTLNFEGVTVSDGELTFGAWGEGFIDSRHPHTLLHEAVLSINFWRGGENAVSISAGRGFTPFGTDDPMARPVLKYPTNHHLSQILERWFVGGALLWRNWSVEAGVFAGEEPTGPYDFNNFHGFGSSWSARVTRRFGAGFGPLAPWEISSSYAIVRGAHGEDDGERAFLTNAAVRHHGTYAWGGLYALLEASRRDLEGDRLFSVLGEVALTRSPDQPYARIEYATRPEYERLPGQPFRYAFDDHHEIGATRWLITSLGYGREITLYPASVRPFVEAQHHLVRRERGGPQLEPEALLGAKSFWSLSFGARIFLGGGPMRMGAYGALDPMTVMHRHAGPPEHPHPEEHRHPEPHHD